MPFASPCRSRPRTRPARCLVAAICATALVALTGAPSATAAPLRCDASALRGAVLGQAALEPVTANRGATACRTAASGGAAVAQALAVLPLNASVLGASTFVTPAGTPNEQQAALAQGGLADLRIRALATLPIQLPTAAIPAGVLTQTVTLPALSLLDPLNLVLNLLLPSRQLTLDLKPAIDALLPNGMLPNVDLVSVGAATAYAGATCRGGRSVPFGLTRVADVKVLGQTVPTDTTATRALNLIDTAAIDLSSIDLSKVTLPGGLLGGLTTPLLTQLQGLIKPLLNLPSISIPATVASVRLTPAGQTLNAAGDRLVQQGPRLQVSVAGQPIADVVLGEATVGTAGVDCTPAAAPEVEPTSAAGLALACTTRRLVLVDVLAQGSRVKLLGAADRKLAGRTVSLRLAATGRTVATAQVANDGSFSAFAPLPPKAIRSTNAARYQAVLGKEKSLDLKLARRMIVSSLTAKNGRVTIAGRVVLPLSKPLSSITLTRRVSCRKNEVVRRFKPRADGTFKVTVAAPTGEDAAVYRLGTRVRRTTRSATTSPTFTLPRGVNLTR
ncbi:MAG: hypothetical protein JWN65_3019 [Solirubrobacterales bacterium]|nr:hypothetical protein [Solirubrobacterales bacterium]